MRARGLRDRVAFDAYTEQANEFGGFAKAWFQHHECAADLIYHKGGEGISAARFSGSKVYKVKVRSCAHTRAVTTDMRLRDVRRGDVYNIREVDAISDPAWVYVVAESGVAT